MEDNQEQFVKLLTEVQLPLQVYIRSLLPGESAVSDVVQQANAKIWEKRHDFELGTNFRAWTLAIARFEVLNFRKTQARDARLRFSDELETTITAELSEADDAADRFHDYLRSCLGKMRSADRQLLLERYLHASLGEYATHVRRSPGGLRVSLHRLRNALRECILRCSRQAEGHA